MPQKLIDLTGRRFGKLSVLSLIDTKRGSRWRCVCDCGAATEVFGHNLRTGNTTSCGCVKAAFGPERIRDLTGRRFGKLAALRLIAGRKVGNMFWVCRCDCGREKTVRSDRLVRGETISCGCAVVARQTMRPIRVRLRSAQYSRRGVTGLFAAGAIERLFRQQRRRCANCRRPITLDTMHRDHIVPLSRGGANHIKNIQLLCIPCNRRKYAKDPIDFAREQGRLL